MTEAWLTLLQFADGLFPAGGFAHSFGLETYVQEGVVRDRAGLEAFVTAHLEGSAGPADAVAAAGAVRQAAAADVAGWMRLDERLEAMKAVPELRAASRQMTAGHHAPVFGAALGRAGVEPAAAAGAYLYSTAALLVGAGLRLVALGQVDGQRVLAAMRPRIARLAAAAAAASADDMWSFTPGLELASLRHATLDARLFRS